MTLLALAFALMAIGCVLVLVEDAARTGWSAAAGAAALLFGLLFAIWAVAARLTKTRKDRTLGHAPELSTLVFPPSSFRVAREQGPKLFTGTTLPRLSRCGPNRRAPRRSQAGFD